MVQLNVTGRRRRNFIHLELTFLGVLPAKNAELGVKDGEIEIYENDFISGLLSSDVTLLKLFRLRTF